MKYWTHFATQITLLPIRKKRGGGHDQYLLWNECENKHFTSTAIGKRERKKNINSMPSNRKRRKRGEMGQRAHSAIQYLNPSFNMYYSYPFCQSGNLKPPSCPPLLSSCTGGEVRGRELLNRAWHFHSPLLWDSDHMQSQMTLICPKPVSLPAF